MNRPLHVAHSVLPDRIYAGSVGKDGQTWLSNQTDVTSEVLAAVIKKVGVGNVVTVEVDGKPTYEIAVKAVAS